MGCVALEVKRGASGGLGAGDDDAMAVVCLCCGGRTRANRTRGHRKREARRQSAREPEHGARAQVCTKFGQPSDFLRSYCQLL